MRFYTLASMELIAALALPLPLAVFAEEAKPGQFKVPGTETTITLSGFIEADMVYDFAGAVEDVRGTDWASFVSFQPLDQGDQKRQPDRLYYTARTSRLGFTTETPTGWGPLTARLEGDFNSPSAFNFSTEATTNGVNFRMRHAYGELAGFLIGQTWSNFMDLGSLPDTVDFNPHGAFALTRQPMVRYKFNVGAPSIALALENPQSIVANTALASGQSLTVGRRFDRYPDVTLNVTIPFRFGHFNLRGVALEYNGEAPRPAGEPPGPENNQWGWGAGVSGFLKYRQETLVWSVQGGNGIGRYNFQSVFQGAIFVGDQIELWDCLAYHVGLTHAWTPAIRSNVIWTQTFFRDEESLVAAAAPIGDIFANRLVNVLFVNSFFSPIKNADLGVEYSFGLRKVFRAAAPPDSDEGTQHRINALARYNFF